jgi:hypothetical protein
MPKGVVYPEGARTGLRMIGLGTPAGISPVYLGIVTALFMACATSRAMEG